MRHRGGKGGEIFLRGARLQVLFASLRSIGKDERVSAVSVLIRFKDE